MKTFIGNSFFITVIWLGICLFVSNCNAPLRNNCDDPRASSEVCETKTETKIIEIYVKDSEIELPESTGGIFIALTVAGPDSDDVIGLDLNNDGLAELVYVAPFGDNQVGLDSDGDGIADFYLIRIGPEEYLLTTEEDGGGDVVKIVIHADTGSLSGFDTDGDGESDITVPPDALSYNNSQSIMLTAGQVVDLTPTITGSDLAFSVEPELPLGLTLDPISGRIFGFVGTSMEQADFTVTATNPLGETEFVLQIQISGTLNALVIDTTIELETSTASLFAMNAVDSDGNGIVDGLDINSDGIADLIYTGLLSPEEVGLDATGDGEADYYLLEGNSGEYTLHTGPGGSGSAILVFYPSSGLLEGFDVDSDGISDETIAPQDLSFNSDLPVADNAGQQINVAPDIIGGELTFSSNPPLPIGLSVDPSTGVVSGFVGSAAESGFYTITATNDFGDTEFIFELQVTGDLETFVESTNIDLPTADASTYTSMVVDTNTDGTMDGLDLNADGIADLVYTELLSATEMGIDATGDGLTDYYLLDTGSYELHTGPGGTGNNVTLVLYSGSGLVEGFDTNTDLVADADLKPSELEYQNGDTISIYIGVPVSISPFVTGGNFTFGVVPTLPTGLLIDSVTGVISGTVSSTMSATGYTITATNPAGQTQTIATIEIPTPAWIHEAYLKAPNNTNSDQFGEESGVSGDTIAIGATREDSTTTSIINDNDLSATNDLGGSNGAAYVYVRSGSTWTAEAYLKAANNNDDDKFGYLGISADTIVVGAPQEDSTTTSIINSSNLSGANDSGDDEGAAYVFVRTGTTWALQSYLKAPNGEGSDIFGSSVAISGNTIAVSAVLEDSSTTSIINGSNLSAANDLGISNGAVYVFTRSGSDWSHQAYLKAPNNTNSDQFGSELAIDVDTIAVGTRWEESTTTAIINSSNLSATDDLGNQNGAVYVFFRSGSWSHQAYLKAPNNDTNSDAFADSVSVSGDTIAVGAPFEDSSTTSIIHGSNLSSANDSGFGNGAVYIFKRGGSTWSHEAYLKVPLSTNSDNLGRHLALDGDLAAIGAPEEDSNTTFIIEGTDLSGSNNSGTENGAAYVFSRSGSTWTLEAYLKPPNNVSGLEFGTGVSISGSTVAVSAPLEESTTTSILHGIDLSSTNTSGASNGAVYIFKFN